VDKGLQPLGARRRAPRSARGFTLIEALISLIMFGVIMGSLSFAFSAARRAQAGSESRLVDNGEVRVIFDALRRDIQAGYASATDPASVFIGNSTSTAGSPWTVTTPGLLTLSTSIYRMQVDELNSASGVMTSSQNTSAANITPQSSLALVTYDMEPNSGILTRSVVSVPNPQLVTAVEPGDNTVVLGKDVVSITFEFWDPTQNAWETTWDYEQQNQATTSATSGTGTGTGTTAATTAASSSSSSSSSASNVNTTFPQAVQVTLVRTNSRGQRVTYTESFPIIAYTPYVDPSTSTTTTTTAAQ